MLTSLFKPLNNTNANPNAATAAAQAFLKNQASSASLASAAAGAALRSRPTTPISVADVQTKRTIRRAESNSSVGSSRNGSVRGQRPELQRRTSSGSMTDRTFRDSSPSGHVPSAHDAPPVPVIPRNLSNSHRRTASLEAPMRMTSPPPNVANGRGSSLGPGNTAPSPRRNGQRIQSLSSVPELNGLQRSDRGSVNFSLPSRSGSASSIHYRELTYNFPQRQQPRITSPANQNLVYDPNTRSFLPYADILAIEERQRVQHAASLPVKKKKRDGPAKATGSHLTDRTMGSKPRGTAIDDLEAAKSSLQHEPLTTKKPAALQEAEKPAPIPEPAATPKKRRPKKVAVASESGGEQVSYTANSSDNDSDFVRRTTNSRSVTPLVKKPSVVREEREREEEEDETPAKTARLEGGSRTFSPSPLPRSNAGRNFSRHKSPSPSLDTPERQSTASPNQQPVSVPKINPIEPTRDEGLTANGNGKGNRLQSVSPSRTAHFAQSPDNLVVRHNPPGRSVSPRKSALKQLSNSSRDQSPMGSDNGTNDLQLPSRKKAHRVSFDETNVMVGEAAGLIDTNSPITQSPQVAKRNWFSLGGRGKKKDTSANDDNDDEIMQPRPVLPSFGSVRGSNPRREPVEERKLIKPADPFGIDTPLPSIPSSPQVTDQTNDELETSIGQSNDHVVGAVFSQDAASKHEANISKSREPLPPQVTSVEGSGYHSDSDSTISTLTDSKPEDEIMFPVSEPPSEPVEFDSGSVLPESRSESEVADVNVDGPQILLTQPTPILEDKNRQGWFDMPGGFPLSSISDSEHDDQDEVPKIVEHQVTEPTPAMVGIAEPFDGPQPGSPVVGAIAFENSIQHEIIQEEEEDSDTSGVYSDAAEDLSDFEGDGFLSLDAVVESPNIDNTPGLAISTPPESPTIHLAKQRAYQRSGLSETPYQPQMDEGWDKAQEYWKSLSEDKKRRLEQEARDETEDSDSTIEAKPVPKPKKKKMVAVLPAEVPILQQPKPKTRSDRTYQIQPGTKAGKDGYVPAMRSSMRAEETSTTQAPDTHMRRSMRGQGSMRGSLRGDQHPEPKGALQKKSRPVSLPSTGEIRPDPAAVKMHIRALSAASASAAAKKAPTPAAPLRRRGSADSDSSFKRARPAEVTTFRRSMRGSNEQASYDRPTSPISSSRFSLRSMSPTESQNRRPFSAGPAPVSTQMRRSMRNSQDNGPSLRNNKPERTKSPIRLPGFGRSSSAKPAKSKPVPKRSSRFVDSSDEEDSAPAFRSRFVDSSDDDDEPPLPKSTTMRGSMRASQPLRGIPRQSGIDDGDSSDLPDSDDEKSPVAVASRLAKTRQNGLASPKIEPPAIKRSGSGREALSPTYTANVTAPRPQQSRRGSLMSILRRKKPDDLAKVRKSDAESPARRDTPLERSKSDLMAVKRSESYNSISGRPLSPKLQKRNPSATWPLPLTSPTPQDEEQEGRPFTSDAAGGVSGGEERPDLGTRRFTDSGLNAISVNGAGAPKKKKKFQALRRMFKLND